MLNVTKKMVLNSLPLPVNSNLINGTILLPSLMSLLLRRQWSVFDIHLTMHDSLLRQITTCFPCQTCQWKTGLVALQLQICDFIIHYHFGSKNYNTGGMHGHLMGTPHQLQTSGMTPLREGCLSHHTQQNLCVNLLCVWK